MNPMIFILLVGAVFYDIRLLKRMNRTLFVETFVVSMRQGFFIFTFLIGVFFVFGYAATALIFFLFYPFYFSRRVRFLGRLKSLTPGQLSDSTRTHLGLKSSGIILIWLWGTVCLAACLSGLFSIFKISDDKLIMLVLLVFCSSILMLGLIYAMTRESRHFNFREVVGLSFQGSGIFKVWILPVILGAFFALLTTLLILGRDYQPITPMTELLSGTASSVSIFLFLVVAVLAAPFFEEIIFRGFFFYVIRQLKGRLAAFIIVSLLFGMLHYEQYWGDWAAIAMITVLGFMLTGLRVLSKTTVSSIIMHYVYNGAVTVIPIIFLIFSNPIYFKYQMSFAQLDTAAKEELLLESIEKYPRHAPSYNDLAWLYAEEEKNLTEGLALADRALAEDKENAAFWDTKAEVLFKMGRVQEAVAIAERLVKRYPSDSYLKDQLEKFKKNSKWRFKKRNDYET